MEKIERKILNDGELTVFTAQGNVSGEVIRRVIWDFYEQGPVTKNVLWDFTHAEVAELSAEDVTQIAHVPRRSVKLRTGGKTAIVAPSDLAYGLGRMYQTSSQLDGLPFEQQVFREADEAYRWLAEKSTK